MNSMSISNKESIQKPTMVRAPIPVKVSASSEFLGRKSILNESITKNASRESITKNASRESITKNASRESISKSPRRSKPAPSLGVGSVFVASAIRPQLLRKEQSSSSVWTTASSARSNSKEEDEEEEEDYGDDEASSSSSGADASSSSEDEDDSLMPQSGNRVSYVHPQSSGINRLSKLIKKYSSIEELLHADAIAVPSAPAPVHSRITVWNPVPVISSCSSSGVFKSLSSHFVPTEPKNYDVTRTQSSSGGFSSSPPPPPIPPRQLKPQLPPPPPPQMHPAPNRPQTLTGLMQPSCRLPDNVPVPYLEPEGATLCGLMARSVCSSRAPGPSVNSIAASALNYSPSTNSSAQSLKNSAGLMDCSPTSMIMKSVSGSRIVSEAKQQLEKKDFLSPSTSGSKMRPQSLIVQTGRETNPPDLSPRRNSGRIAPVGNKQYEASLSPESAEKKQREILAFFGTASEKPPPERCASDAPRTGQHKTVLNPVQVRFRAKSAAPIRPRAVSEGFHPAAPSHSAADELTSDVDELFDKLLAGDDVAAVGSRGLTVAGNSNFSRDFQCSAASSNGAPPQLDQQPTDGGELSAKLKFQDRRRVWEQSTSSLSKLHLNQSVTLSSE